MILSKYNHKTFCNTCVDSTVAQAFDCRGVQSSSRACILASNWAMARVIASLLGGIPLPDDNFTKSARPICGAMARVFSLPTKHTTCHKRS